MEGNSQDPSGRSGDALPTFMVIGAMKCGTTSLAMYLGAHPDVFMTTPKEPHFFNDDKNWERGVEWYRSLFADAGAARARGEATPGYTKALRWPGVPARIASVVPDVLLIYLVRDPIERIRSEYSFHVRRNGERHPIDEIVVEDPWYLDTSRYAHQLEVYLEHFDREQILVLWSEDLKERRVETMMRAFEFIGVDPELDVSSRVLDRELNRTDRLREPAKWSHAASRVAGRTPLALLPSGSKRRLSRLAKRRINPPDTTLGPDAEAWLGAQLVSDGKRLETLIGETPPWLARLASSANG